MLPRSKVAVVQRAPGHPGAAIAMAMRAPVTVVMALENHGMLRRWCGEPNWKDVDCTRITSDSAGKEQPVVEGPSPSARAAGGASGQVG